MALTTIFVETDDFCKEFEKQFSYKVLSSGEGLRKRDSGLSLSEIITISIYYHYSGYKTFKDFYLRDHDKLKSAFPGLVSYSRFVELQQKVAIVIILFLQLRGLAKCNGISFIDSFPLRVCDIKRASSHKTFKGLAAKGKTSMGWFFGFKVHLVINTAGQIVSFMITSGNIADNNSNLIMNITKNLFGKIFGDRGYLLRPELFEKLYMAGKQMITKIRSNMKNKLMDMEDKMLLKKRGVIESVGNILKNVLNIEHSRYRSPVALIVNVCCALMAYFFREDKPSITVDYNANHRLA